MKVWHLGPERAAEWRAIRLEALAVAPEAFEAGLDEWEGRPLSDFAARLAEVPTFAAGLALGQPLAVAAWCAAPDRRDARQGWLISVYARPEMRGQGFAEAAVRAALADATGAGMTSIGLSVRDTAVHAQALYRRLGFRAMAPAERAETDGGAEIEMVRGLP